MLSMWVVYDSPSDYPGRAIARRFEIDSQAARPTDSTIIAPDLNALRAILVDTAPWAVPVPRDASDEPQIVEVWL